MDRQKLMLREALSFPTEIHMAEKGISFFFFFHLFVDSTNLYLDATSRLKPTSHIVKQKEKKKTQEIAREH